MATNKTTEVITVEIGGEKRTLSTVKEIKQAMKELKNEAIQGNKEAVKSFAELQDKLEDLKDTTKSVKGDGVERLQSSFGLLTESLSQADFGKFKVAMQGLGSAMKALPLIFIIEGVKYLVENFDELSKGSGILAKALQFVATIFTAIGDGITWLTDKFGWTNSQLDAMGEKAVETFNKTTAAVEAQNKALDDQIKVAKASGEATIEMERQKLRNIIATNKALLEQLLAFKNAGGELSEEQVKLLTQGTAAINSALADMKVLEINHHKELDEKRKESGKKWKEIEDKKLDEAKKLQADEADRMNAAIDKEEADAKKLADRRAKDLEDLKALQLKKDQGEVADFIDKENKIKVARDKAKADHIASENAKRQATATALNAAQGLSQAFFASQLNRAKGNAQAEIAIKKKMFEVDKAFNVARAVQDGIRSVQAALTIPPPGGQLLAVANGIMAAANVAKILATKFDEGGGSADIGAVSAGAPQVGGGGALPQLNNGQSQQLSQPKTQFNEQGQNLTLKAYVVEEEISDSQKGRDKVKKMSEF
jgi:hypothetical protein